MLTSLEGLDLELDLKYQAKSLWFSTLYRLLSQF